MRFDLPEDKKLTLEMTIPIRWGDMDAMGHRLLYRGRP